MMLTPEQRPTLTISESGVVLTETHDGNEVPADCSFAIVNDYVHAHGRHFEELQYLALGMASHIDAQQARIAELEQDAARLDFIERMAKQSRTGVGIDWVRHVEDGFVTDHGYRVMWHHTLNDRKRDMRSAIDAAMQK